MNTNKISFGSLFAAVTLLASLGAATAGGPPHRLPADYGTVSPAYEIRIASMPTAGHMLTIQLVNKDTGQLVTNAHVSMQHMVWKGPKAVPLIQAGLVALDSDGHGNYVCAREHVRQGEHIVVRAHVPGEPSGTWATLTLNI